MRRGKIVPKPLSEVEGTPFTTAEEAWLWFSQCQIARMEGVRFTADNGQPRPCEPDDIYCAVTTLRRRESIGDDHIRVLGRFGRRLLPPHAECGDGEGEIVLWNEALDRLTGVLRPKGIVL